MRDGAAGAGAGCCRLAGWRSLPRTGCVVQRQRQMEPGDVGSKLEPARCLLHKAAHCTCTRALYQPQHLSVIFVILLIKNPPSIDTFTFQAHNEPCVPLQLR